jgi:putative SOS response-associated peptidase YedK
MCARLFLSVSDEELAEFLETAGLPDIQPRYNIAPGQDILVVRAGADGQRQPGFLRWGLVPRWSKDPRIGQKLINARSETAFRRTVFRDALRARRCLVPAAGFYEWKRIGRVSQPYLVRPRAGLLAVAGLWDEWEGGGRRLETCTLLTTQANERIAPVHDRMPVLLDRDRFTRWLDPGSRADDVASLLVPYPAEKLVVEPVSTLVNRVDVDDPRCLEPVEISMPVQGRLF